MSMWSVRRSTGNTSPSPYSGGNLVLVKLYLFVFEIFRFFFFFLNFVPLSLLCVYVNLCSIKLIVLLVLAAWEFFTFNVKNYVVLY